MEEEGQILSVYDMFQTNFVRRPPFMGVNFDIFRNSGYDTNIDCAKQRNFAVLESVKRLLLHHFLDITKETLKN
jgi:hypothetical protein